MYGHQGKPCSQVHPGFGHDDFADRREAEEEKRIAGTKLLGPIPELQILGPDSARASVNTIPIEDLRKTIDMAETLRQPTGGRVRSEIRARWKKTPKIPRSGPLAMSGLPGPAHFPWFIGIFEFYFESPPGYHVDRMKAR